VAEEQARTARDSYEAEQGTYERLPVNPPHLPQGDPQLEDPQCYSTSQQGGMTVIAPRPVLLPGDPSHQFRRLACDCQHRVITMWLSYLKVLGSTVAPPVRKKHAQWIAEDALKFFCSPYEIFKKCLLAGQDKNLQENCLENYAGSTSGFVFDVLLDKYAPSKSRQR
jgi:hypothetical protein